MEFCFISMASHVEGPHRTGRAALDVLEKALLGLGARRCDPAVADGERMGFYFLRSGGVEYDVIRRYRSRAQQGRAGPMLLIAHPANNSLPAALEILAQVRQEGGAGRIYLLRGPEDHETLAEIAQTVRCLAANQKLSEERLGMIGESSDWLVASSHRPEILSNRFGLKVVPLTVGELRAHMAREPEPAAGPEFTAWDRAASVEGVTSKEFSRAVGVYRGLKELVGLHRLSAVTLRCFDLLEAAGTTGCLALSRLADEGVTAGCEGDIPSVVLLRWLWHLTGQAGWMANPSDLDVRKGEMLLAHCTVPLGMVEEYRLKTHYESGRGVGLDGSFRTGPVTLLRLGGARLEQWWGAEGTLFESRHADGLCRTQVRVRVPSPAVAELLQAPLGNHLVMVKGYHKGLFREAMEWSRVREKSVVDGRTNG